MEWDLVDRQWSVGAGARARRGGRRTRDRGGGGGGRGAVAGVPATGVVVAPAHTFSDSVQAGAGHRPLTLSRLPTATPDAAPPVPAGPTGAAGAGSFEGSAAALAETAPRTATPGTTPTKSV